MKILIADKLSQKAIENLKKLGALVVIKPDLTAEDLRNTMVMIIAKNRHDANRVLYADVDMSTMQLKEARYRNKTHKRPSRVDKTWKNLWVIIIEGD